MPDNHTISEVNRQPEDLEDGLHGGLVPVARSLPDAPLGERLMVPPGYSLAREGIRRQSGDGEATRVAACPLMIVGILRDIHDGGTWWKIAMRREGTWRERTIPRDRGLVSWQLVNEARYDLPVTSNNTRAVVAYLAAFETVNRERLPQTRLTQSLGWQDSGGDLGFLWGECLLGPESDGPNRIVFHAEEDQGAAGLADGFHASGTAEGWRDAVLECTPFPSVMVALYSSIVPVLLHIVREAPNFAICWAGPTSCGKTTALRVAASLWGLPDERADGCLLTWDTTRVGIERTASVLGSLPLILDDTKRAAEPRVVAQAIYDVSSGRGRTRGSLDGIQRTAQFRTVLLLTGESPATSATEDGGTRARTIDIFGPPFGKTDAETADLVRRVTTGLLTHYGHAGPQLVQRLYAGREGWAKIADAFREARDRWAERARGNPVGARQAGYFAMLEVAGRMVHRLFNLPGDHVANLRAVWDVTVENVEEADPPLRALAQLRGWASSHQQEFWGRHEKIQTRDGPGGPRVPNQGWAGAWRVQEDWDEIAFLPPALDRVLQNLGHEPRGIILAWRERGWIRLTGQRKRKRHPNVIVHTDRPRCVCVTRKAFDLATEPTDPS